ncbi:MAG: inorganic phosphate transporter [Alphaproteobacteria bacterium]
MDLIVLFFLTSGLFLGWSLGANDAANVFGTAVGTRMVRFTTAAVIATIFVILGAVISGAGAAHTLGKLGAVNAMGGSFMAATAAAIAVFSMTKLGLPVSTTQAIIGAIIGWNLFSGADTDRQVLATILVTWVVCPVLAAIFAAIVFKCVTWYLRQAQLHLLRQDAYTRLGLILAGAFGAYSLGANNIANVMGVFLPASPFTDFSVGGLFQFTSAQQLFLLGALAIGVGIFTYSRKVMVTVGKGLLPMSPVAAWVVVVAHSLVLFLFASQGLEAFLAGQGLPTIPLVPVSSSQAVVGAVLGIALLKGGRGIRWRVLGGIGVGWVVTPILSGLICFIGLFFLQNVFNQQVYRMVSYELTAPALAKIETIDAPMQKLRDLKNKRFHSAEAFRAALEAKRGSGPGAEARILAIAKISDITIAQAGLERLARTGLSAAQLQAVRRLSGRKFPHRWMLKDALAKESRAWHAVSDAKRERLHNRELDRRLDMVIRAFQP